MKFNFLSLEPHSFEEILLALADANENEPDFIALLKSHHDYLQESIDVLMDAKATVDDKREHLTRFLILLDMHGHAEEETLYRRLVADDHKALRVEGLGGQEEHDIAYKLGDELLAMDYSRVWTDDIDAKAKVLVSMVKNHIKEEESEMFKAASKQFSALEFDAMTRDYVTKCILYLNDDLTPPPGSEVEITTRFYR